MLDLESAINVKKSLNLSTTVSGSKVYRFCDISQSPKSQQFVNAVSLNIQIDVFYLKSITKSL